MTITCDVFNVTQSTQVKDITVTCGTFLMSLDFVLAACSSPVACEFK